MSPSLKQMRNRPRLFVTDKSHTSFTAVTNRNKHHTPFTGTDRHRGHASLHETVSNKGHASFVASSVFCNTTADALLVLVSRVCVCVFIQ